MSNYSGFFLIPFLAALIFSGCSISHKLSRYDSKDEFYKDFNGVMKERSVEVVTKDNKVIEAEDGADAVNDTINIIHKGETREEKVIALKLINTIQYKEYYANKISGLIQMRDGTIFDAEYITPQPDSMKFINVNHFETRTPLHFSDVERVTYTRHWLGIPAGLIFGFASGIAVGLAAPLPIYEGPHGDISNTPGPGKRKSLGNNIVICAFSGIIIGGILGYIIGFDYDYYPDR